MPGQDEIELTVCERQAGQECSHIAPGGFAGSKVRAKKLQAPLAGGADFLDGSEIP